MCQLCHKNKAIVETTAGYIKMKICVYCALKVLELDNSVTLELRRESWNGKEEAEQVEGTNKSKSGL